MTDTFVSNGCFKALAGKKYFVAGELSFPIRSVPYRVDRFYRTHYGYGVPHSGLIYARNDHNTALALRRLTGSREPDTPGAEDALQAANRYHFNVTMQPIIAKLKETYAPYLLEYLGMREEARLHHADPHPKRELRIRAYTDLVDTGQINQRYWGRIYKGRVIAEAKMKTEEYAKPGKRPRMIVDLGVAASLQGFRLTELLKQAQSGAPFHYKGGVIQFIKDPNPLTMQKVFDNLRNPPGRFYFCYFSDDACYSVRTQNGVVSCNLDISSCDASHTEAVFDALRDLMPQHAEDDMSVLIEQCSWPLRIKSLSCPKTSVVIAPNRPRLYSGSTITTAINNLANIGIAVAIVDANATDSPTIVAAARSAGYIVTVDLADIPEKLQFLKHSPAMDSTGEYRPLLNPGVMFRLVGTCKRDLPGRGPVRPRAEVFQKALLTGLYSGVSFPLLERMRAAVAHASLDSKAGQIATQTIEKDMLYRPVCNAPATFSDAAVFRRYFLSPNSLELVQRMGEVHFEEQVGNEAIATVLAADYGLTINRDVSAGVAPAPLQQVSVSCPYRLYEDLPLG